MHITERLKGRLPSVAASTAPSTASQALPPLYDPAERVRLVASLLGSTTDRRHELAHWLSRELESWHSKVMAGPDSAAKNKANRAAKIDAAIEYVLGPKRAATNTAPQTAAVLQRRLRAIGWGKFGIKHEPSERALRDGIERYMARTLASEPRTGLQAVHTVGSEAHDGTSRST